MATSSKKADELPSFATMTSCSDSDTSMCKCKDKIENYQIIIKNLEQELSSTRVRKEGVETIAKLLMEARMEIAVLIKKNKQHETRVHELQGRLERHNLPCNIQQDENELYVPQTSKQILDNLTRENSRLRNLLRQCTVNPDEIEKQRQILLQRTEHLQEVKKELSRKQQDVDRLEGALRGSDNEKDRIISEYKETVKKLQQGSKVQDVVCRSLSEESSCLRQQLKDVAVTCQKLAMKLDESEKVTAIPTTPVSGDITPSLQQKIQKIQDLTNRNEEIAMMNKRWQTYNVDQVNRIQMLEQKNQELSVQLGNADGISENQQKEANQLIVKSRERIEKLIQDLQRKETECNILQKKFGETEEENRNLRANRHGNLNMSTTSDGDIDALKVQIQILTEDFESERLDRERAQSKISDLEQENQKLLKERHALLMGQQQAQAQAQAQAQQVYRYMNPTGPAMYNPTLPRMPGDAGLVARGKLTTDAADIQPANPPSPNSAAAAKPQPNYTTLNQPNTKNFSCPKCGKIFLVEQHNQLLDHIQQCCE